MQNKVERYKIDTAIVTRQDVTRIGQKNHLNNTILWERKTKSVVYNVTKNRTQFKAITNKYRSHLMYCPLRKHLNTLDT